MHLGAWNAHEMGVYPRMRCAALSWPSDSLTYTSDCRILSKLILLTKWSEGVVELGSAMSLKQEKHISVITKSNGNGRIVQVKL